jgi:hypothetical protein
MSGSSFELLMEEVLNQKRIMDELIAENHNLRRQLTNLREGRGIFLEIQGQLFALDGETAFRSPQVGSTAQDAPIAEQATTIIPVSEAAVAPGTGKETLMPSTDPFEQLYHSLNANAEEEEAPATTSTFLEDMLVDEFGAAATSPMAVWKGAKKTRKLTGINEEEKAALRKELMGSFLLE